MYHLAQLKFSGQQVMSIEDPVEIKQEAMLQLQLNETIGMTYDSLIKLSLRHRPDLLIIGEIRDRETARAVVRASLTGATVFSTIHAKSVRGVYERLLELGVSEDELRMVLQGVCYQRLIGGGGVVDFVSQTIKSTKPQSGISRLISFLQKDISVLSKGRPKKLSTPKQKKIIELFHNLFSSGFHLAEIVDFLRRSALRRKYVTEMRAGLSAGQSFSEIVSRLGFSDSVVTQLSLSELHGNLTLSLGKIEAYLENLSKVRKN